MHCIENTYIRQTCFMHVCLSFNQITERTDSLMNSKSKKVSAIVGASLLVAGSGIAYIVSNDSLDANNTPDKHKSSEDSSQKSTSSLKIKNNGNIDAQKLSDYIVVKGDSTMSLAKRFNVTRSSLLKKFNLSKDDKLIPGVKMKDQANKIHEKADQSSSSASQVSSSDTNTPMTTDESTSVTASSEEIAPQSTPQVQTPQPAPAVPTTAQPVVQQAPPAPTPAPAPVQQAPAPVEQAPAPVQQAPAPAPSAPSSDPNSTNIGSASDIMNSLG